MTLLITTGVTGLSCAPVGVEPILSTTACEAASFTSPKIVCLRLSQAVAATVIGIPARVVDEHYADSMARQAEGVWNAASCAYSN